MPKTNHTVRLSDQGSEQIQGLATKHKVTKAVVFRALLSVAFNHQREVATRIEEIKNAQ